MSSTYTYSKSVDFGGELNTNLLKDLIIQEATITTTLDIINTRGNSVLIIFVSHLSPAEKTSLDNVVANYTFKQPAENFLYDKQYVSNSVITSTTANSFVDIDSMVLTTTDLGGSSSYIITFNAEISTSGRDNSAEFQILIDGKSSQEQIMRYTQSRNSFGPNNFNCFTICYFAKNITSGTEIKVQFRRVSSNATVYVNLRKLIIDGVRDNEINN